MSVHPFFEPEARAEFIEAIAWYENESPGLGNKFADEVLQTIKHARAQPRRYRQVRGRARKIRLKRFKSYSIYFAIKNDVFSVISIFHGARNPDELLRRLK